MEQIVVVGAGFAGSVLARKIAEECNEKVLVIEKRSHVAGNAYDEFSEGILVQKYGPHFLATYEWWVIEYLSRFTDFYEYPIKAVSYVDGRYIARPYNFRTLQQLVGPSKAQPLLRKLRESFPDKHRITLYDLFQCKDEQIYEYGQLLCEKVYAPYVAKQWGEKLEEISQDVINRSEIVLGYDSQLVDWDFQYLPSSGYTELISNMLNHPNIEVMLNTDAMDEITMNDVNKSVLYKKKKVKALIYTGPIDDLFKNVYGHLPYRSRYFTYETYNDKYILPCGVVTYPKEKDYIRQTEFKHFNPYKLDSEKTIVQSEYSLPYMKNAEKGNDPYYPIINNTNNMLYEKYRKKAKRYKNLFLCGRLAEYKYYDMDKVVIKAFDVFNEMKESGIFNDRL